MAALLVGALILALVDRWRKKQLNEILTVQDELSSYRELYQRGELSADEYEKIRRRVAARLKVKQRPAAVRDPETGARVVVKSPTEPALPPEPKTMDAPPSPPPDLPTS
jgi:hypothetical protein